jgi:hypothetical protein|nr:hypothetical protein [uncultured Methanoregula sp.]
MKSWICFGMVVLQAGMIAIPGANADDRTFEPVIAYSLTGWPLKNPVNIFGAGKLALFRPGGLTGMFA